MVTLGVRELRVRQGRSRVFDAVSVNFTDTERWAILGANGAGKTTLLTVLSGARRPDAGTVTRDGEPVRQGARALAAHRSLVQLVMQDPDDQLFSADVASDISFGPLNQGLTDAEALTRVDEACSLLGLDDLRDRPVHQLSGGEAKRVAMAGAVAMRPAVLLLDEPTAGLDPQGVEEMLGVLDRLESEGTTIIMSTHDVDLALAWSTQVAIITDGTVRTGPTPALLADHELLHAARLRRPWPLELTGRLSRLGVWPNKSTPRNLDDVVDELSTLLRGREA